MILEELSAHHERATEDRIDKITRRMAASVRECDEAHTASIKAAANYTKEG